MKKIFKKFFLTSSFVFLFSFVFVSSVMATSALPDGCDGIHPYSVTTGHLCFNSNLPDGCDGVHPFSATTGLSCGSTGTPTFSIGDWVTTNISNVAAHSNASSTSPVLATYPINTGGTVLDGPTVSGGSTWWEVGFAGGTTGWTVTANLTKSNTNTNTNNGSTESTGNTTTLSIGDTVSTTTILNVRSSAANVSVSNIVAEVKSGTQGTIKGGPTVANGYTWWQIDYTGGVTGWSVETYLTKVSGVSANGSANNQANSTGISLALPIGCASTANVSDITGLPCYGSTAVSVVLYINGLHALTVPTGSLLDFFYRTNNIIAPTCNITGNNGAPVYSNLTAINGYAGSSITASQTATYTITCATPSGNVSDSVVVTIGNANSVTMQGVGGAPTVTITANPKTILSGQAIAINYTSTGATGCIEYDSTADASASLGAGFYLPTTSVITNAGYQNVTTTYEVTCTNNPNPRSLRKVDETTTTAQITLPVSYSTTFSATANLSTIFSGQSVSIGLMGTQATYSWHLTVCNVNNSGKCGSTDTGFEVGASGGGSQGQWYNYTSTPYTVTYTAQALDKNNNVLWTSPTGSIVVAPSVTPPVSITSFSASSLNISAGQSSTLSWSTVGMVYPDFCQILDGPFGSTPTVTGSTSIPWRPLSSGTVTVTPTQTTNYSLICNDIGSTVLQEKALTITVR